MEGREQGNKRVEQQGRGMVLVGERTLKFSLTVCQFSS